MRLNRVNYHFWVNRCPICAHSLPLCHDFMCVPASTHVFVALESVRELPCCVCVCVCFMVKKDV